MTVESLFYLIITVQQTMNFSPGGKTFSSNNLENSICILIESLQKVTTSFFEYTGNLIQMDIPVFTM